MRAALLRWAAGTPTTLPYRAGRQIVAARYGQSPRTVDAWPVDDYLTALAMLPWTGPPREAIE